MGWCNYVLIPKWKIMIEVSRHINEDALEYSYEQFNKLSDDIEEFGEDVIWKIPEKRLKELKVIDITRLYEIADKSVASYPENRDYLLLYWLKSMGIEFEIRDEFQVNEDKDKYKNWKILSRW